MSAPGYMKRGDVNGEYSWDRDNVERTDTDENFLMDNWEAAVTIAESSDPHASYDFDDYALIQIGDEYFVTNASGCSCPSHEDVWGINHRGDRDSTEKYISTEAGSEAWREFQREVHKQGWNVPNPEPGNRYDW